MYAEAILDPGEGGRVVPGLAALDHSTNAAQPQKRLVPKGWGGIGGIAALRPRGKPVRAAQRWRALHCPQWRSHIRDSIYEFVDFTRTNRDFLSDFLPKKMTPLQEEMIPLQI